MSEDNGGLVSNEDDNMNDEYIRQKHRHPVGTWIIFKDKTDLCHVKVHSDISIRYTLGKRSLPHGKILAKGRLEKS